MGMGRYSYKNAIELLRQYAEKEGYEDIDLSYHDISKIWYKFKKYPKIHIEPKYIKIQDYKDYEIKTYVFLHELGHHELAKNWELYSTRFPSVAHAEYNADVYKIRKFRRRKDYHVTYLEEEFMAWDKGLELAKNLGIRVNMEKFWELKNNCVKSYISGLPL
jgi:hypothetical protein